MSHFLGAGLRAALMGGLATAAIMAPPALAQGEKAFNIPAQEAASAVPSFVQQSGLHVLAAARDLQGVRTNAVRGNMTPDAALKVLISGTGLTVKAREGGAIVISRAVVVESRATDIDTTPAEPVQDVIIFGVRKSLREALDIKRRQSGIMEAASSKDIGALPDVTIAETLNRMPGVNTARDRGNDSQASIRGLGARMVLGTVNGREVASSEPDRNIRWEIYPSEVVAGVSVYKSSEARLLSGGISGTVDIQTIRPLDYRGPALVVRAGPVYYNAGTAFPDYDGLGYRASMSWVTKLAPDLGIVLGLTSQKQKNGYESVQGWGYNAGADRGPVLTSQPTTPYNTPWGAQAEAKKLSETRFGASLGLQYRPHTAFQLGYDLLYSDIRINEYQDQAWWGDGVWGNWQGSNYGNYVAGEGHAGRPATLIDGDVVAATVSYAPLKSVLARYTEDKTLIVTGVNGRWTGGAWTVSADASYSQARRFNVWRAAEFQYWPDYMAFNFSGKPSVTVSSLPQSNWQTPADGQWETGRVADSLSAAHLDIKRQLDGPFTAILFGARVSDRRKESGTHTGLVTPTAGVFDPSVLVTPYAFKNFAIPSLLTGDFGRIANALYSNPFDFDPKAQAPTDRVSENVSEVYAEGTYATTFGGVPIDGNIGLRLLDVTSESHGNSTALGAWIESPPGSGVWVQQITVTPASGGVNYSRVLPSATARFDFGHGRYLKLAAAQVVSRPPLNDMIITRSISAIAPYVGSAGNPYLRPFEATQLDASYEWYFSKDALLAVSAYHKAVSHFVGYASRTEVINGNSYVLTSPVNSTKGGDIDGVELTWQTPLSAIGLDHFGVYSNYAYVNSDLKEMTASLPMNGLARHTATVDLWYSDRGFDARLGAKYHSTYTAIYGWNDAALIRVRPETTMDLSLSYMVNPHIQVRFQANNLLDTPLRTYQDNRPTRLGRHDYYGQRVLLDLTVRY